MDRDYISESVEMVDEAIECLQKARKSLQKDGCWKFQQLLLNARELAKKAEDNLTTWNPCGPI
jgi:hypothetical protein